MRLALYLSVLGLVAGILPASAGQKDFNGRWAITGTTEEGRCEKAFRLRVRVLDGRAYMIGRSLSGTKTAISSRGQVNVKYVHGHDVITANGRLKAGTGGGYWEYKAQRCAGRWRAERM